MNEANNPSHYHAFEITEKGMELRQQVVAGEKANKKLIINFTKGAIGQGRPQSDEDPYFFTSLVDSVLNVPIKENYAKHINHVMTIVIDNTELESEILMSEMGIFARIVDAITGEEIFPEVLYGYTFTYKYDYIPSTGNYFIYREVSFNTILSREGKFTIVFDKSKVYLTHKEFNDFCDEIGWPPTPVSCVIEHNLSTYPKVLVTEVTNGFGILGFGEMFGGGSSREVKTSVIYNDQNKIHISILKNVTGTPILERTGRNEYILRYPDNTVLYVLLFEQSYVTHGVGENRFSGELNLLSELAIRQLVAGEISSILSNISASNSNSNSAIAALNATITQNKKSADSNINDLSNRITQNVNAISSNKSLADTAINGLDARINTLSATVTNNKSNTDDAITTLETNLTNKISSIPTGFGK